jgi:hypothetical protein
VHHFDTDHFFIGPHSTLTTLTPGIGQHLTCIISGHCHKTHTWIVKLTHNVQGQVAIERNLIQAKYVSDFTTKVSTSYVANFHNISASGS